MIEMLTGRFALLCREPDGTVGWEVSQANLITDFARRRYFTDLLRNYYLFTSPSSEQPLIGRSMLTDDGGANSSQSAAVTPSYDNLGITKTWFYSFPTPSGNRRIGTVGLGRWAPNVGIYQIWAYSLLNPVKTQGPSQTLELRYTIALNPVY